MNITVVRYRVKPEQADHNKDLVAAVYDELDRTQPDGLHYATFIADDVAKKLIAAREPPERAAAEETEDAIAGLA